MLVSITGFTSAGECTCPLEFSVQDVEDVKLIERTITITMLEEQNDPWNPSGGQFLSVSFTAADAADSSTLDAFTANL